MKILVACEESQAVTIELRKLGHQAFSCDIMECSGGYPEWHIKGDVLEQLDKGWDMLIGFPPCTYLTVTGARWLYNKDGSKNKERWDNMKDGLDFFIKLFNAPIDKIVLENPIGLVSANFRKPDQIIQPYWFGDNAQKSTCLWLKNVNKLEPTKMVHKGENVVLSSGKVFSEWYYKTSTISTKDGLRAKMRSKTFPGIARAMAEQFTQPLKQLKFNF